MTYLALIPARAGSKGIPGKNIKPLGGRPLLGWTIQHALDAKLIERVVVSTDGKEIATVAHELGAEVPFMRPAELATDDASTETAMIHAVEMLRAQGRMAEFVVLLQPTCPIRAPGAIDAAIRLLELHGADSLVSGREIHPFLWSEPACARAHYDFRNRPRRQDIASNERLYEENGSIYITRTEMLLAEKCRLGGKIVIYPMSAAESIDIDTPDDFLLAEAMLTTMESI